MKFFNFFAQVGVAHSFGCGLVPDRHHSRFFIGVSSPAERVSALEEDARQAAVGLRSFGVVSGGSFSHLVLPRRCYRVKFVFARNLRKYSAD